MNWFNQFNFKRILLRLSHQRLSFSLVVLLDLIRPAFPVAVLVGSRSRLARLVAGTLRHNTLVWIFRCGPGLPGLAVSIFVRWLSALFCIQSVQPGYLG